MDEYSANGIYQAGFFLRGGGLIELIGPLDPANEDDGFVKFMKKRGEGFQQMSVDASAGGSRLQRDQTMRFPLPLYRNRIGSCSEKEL